MQVPFGGVSILFCLGVCLGRCFPPLPLLGIFALAFVLAGMAAAWASLRPVLLALLVLLVGWVDYLCATEPLSPFDLRLLIGLDPEEVVVRGILDETPVIRSAEFGKTRLRTTVPLRVTQLARRGRWEPAAGKVMAMVSGGLDPHWSEGQAIEADGVLERPRTPLAEGLFDYRAYLEELGIYYQLTIRSTQDVALAGELKRPGVCQRFFEWAQRTLAKGLPEEDEPLRLLWAMTLGWKPALTNEVSAPFMQTGTLHVFAISGLHVALLAGILVSLLRVAQVPRSICGMIVLPLLWFYTAATGFQASAIRSTIMMSVIIAGWSLSRPSDLVNSLGAAAVLILCWDPCQLFQAGFQLSFAVVLSLAMISSALEKTWRQIFRRDPLRPPDPAHGTGWWRLPLNFFKTSVVTSLAAWAGSLPLIAYYFHMVTPVSLGANLVIVPLSSLALMSSLGSLICGDWLPVLTELFNFSAWWWMWCMIRVSEWMAAWPKAYYYVKAPHLWILAAYYATLTGLFASWIRARLSRWISLSAGLAFAAALILAGWRWEAGDVRITVLPDAGTLLIEGPGRDERILVDCGSERSAQTLVKPFLQARGINRIGHLILTHGDVNHVGGFELIEKEFRVGDVITSSARFRSAVYQRVLHLLEKGRHRWRRAGRGDEISGWKVLHPDPTDRFTLADDQMLVLGRRFGSTGVLLLSELGSAGQELLSMRESALRADVVVASASSRRDAIKEHLLDRLQPRQVIWLANRAYHGANHFRQQLEQRGCQYFPTAECGAVTIRIMDGQCQIETGRKDLRF